MKRSSLLRHLRRYGCYLKREGRAHSLWWNPTTGLSSQSRVIQRFQTGSPARCVEVCQCQRSAGSSHYLAIHFNRPLAVAEDERRSQEEPKYHMLGQTDGGRKLFIVFTIRSDLVRVISARNMNRRERRVYDRAKEERDTAV